MKRSFIAACSLVAFASCDSNLNHNQSKFSSQSFFLGSELDPPLQVDIEPHQLLAEWTELESLDGGLTQPYKVELSDTQMIVLNKEPYPTATQRPFVIVTKIYVGCGTPNWANPDLTHTASPNVMPNTYMIEYIGSNLEKVVQTCPITTPPKIHWQSVVTSPGSSTKPAEYQGTISKPTTPKATVSSAARAPDIGGSTQSDIMSHVAWPKRTEPNPNREISTFITREGGYMLHEGDISWRDDGKASFGVVPNIQTGIGSGGVDIGSITANPDNMPPYDANQLEQTITPLGSPNSDLQRYINPPLIPRVK